MSYLANVNLVLHLWQDLLALHPWGYVVAAALGLVALIKRKTISAVTSALWKAGKERFLGWFSKSLPHQNPTHEKTYRGRFMGIFQYENPPHEWFFEVVENGVTHKVPVWRTNLLSGVRHGTIVEIDTEAHSLGQERINRVRIVEGQVSSATPPSSKRAPRTHRLLKKPWFWSVLSFFVALGFPIVVPNAESIFAVYFGWLLWSLPVVLFLAGLWQESRFPQWINSVLVLACAATFLWAAHRNIVDRLRPSFVFIAPGVVLNGDTWDFLANHRGPKTSYNTQILFIDEDRKDYLTRTQTSLTPADINSCQVLWALPEVNPMGRGNIFAQQFLWKPFNLSFSHFTAEITWRDGSVHEEIQIARVKDKWQYALRVSDRESGKRLIWCRDSEFPSSDAMPPCFPQVTEPSE